MTRFYALEAIRAMPWAIQPEYMGAIEAIAARALESPVLEILRTDGHAERYSSVLSAADTGEKLAGTRRLTVNRAGVATLPVMGPIFPRANMMTEFSGATSLDSLSADLQAAQDATQVQQILLLMDTPGGVTTGVSDFAKQVAASKKPITVYVPGACASAGYWIASQASSIVMDDTALVGSLGIVVSGSTQVQADRQGRMGMDITSSNAPNKRLDVTNADDQAQIRAMLDEVEAVFLSAVASGRGTTLESVKQNFGQGGMKAAKSAVASGMADRIDTLGNTLARLGAQTPLKPTAKSQKRTAAQADFEARRNRAEKV
ncbi:MAG: S49 family peptidase [Acetobacter orientalis]|uniref:S49 family peptidase n=1 Tax=Acetobacter orientalis TaxID=146474 RepID=UPI0039EA945F